jgi:AcrR family transcriptional regulator
MPRTPAQPRLGRPPSTSSADTKRRILDTARAAFATRGYEASTNRTLGADAGITAGALYHYFGSKFDLYLAVHQDVQERVYQRFNDAVDEEVTFRDQLEAVLDTAHEMNLEDPTLAQFLGSVRVDMRRHQELHEALSHSAEARQNFFDRMVDVGEKTGEIDPADRQRVRGVLLTILIGLTDAVSEDPVRHRNAIDGIKELIEGKLFRPL